MTAKKMVDENVRVDKATVISSKNMFQMNGQSRFYSRNLEFIHETTSERRFRGKYFWIRVNEHFTLEECYQLNSEKYKICQVINPVD